MPGNTPYRHSRRRRQAAAMLCGVSLLAPAVLAPAATWTRENRANGNTLLLYHFNGSGTTIEDSNGNNIDGTLANVSARAGASPAWLSPPSGDYLSQSGSPSDGMDDKVTISGANMGQGLSVSLWYRARAGDTQGGHLFRIEGPGATPRAFVTTDQFGTGGNGRLRLQAGGNQGALVDFGAANDWRHVGVVFDPLNGDVSDGGDWRFYLDNTLQYSVSDFTDYSSTASFGFQVGNDTFNNGPLLGGDLDEVLVQNSIITDFSDGFSKIPEPASFAMFFAGILTLLGLRRRVVR